jgi:DNA-binding transcriptional LysR family regulator
MQALILLDDLRSMRRAAEALGMSQPAMTQLVSEFEQLLETQLFLRHSRGVAPTPAALDLLPVARRILIATEEGAQLVATRMSRDSGPVRVAATVAGMGAILDRALPQIGVTQPSLQVQVEPVVGQGLDASFSSNDFDMVCCRMRQVVPEEWTFRECISDEIIVVAGSAHPLASRSALELEELGGEIWLQHHVATIARHHFDDLRERMGWTMIREAQMVSRNPLLIWSMLREGKMLSLMPRSVVTPWLREGSIVMLPVAVQLPLEPIGFYWQPAHAGPGTHQLAGSLEVLIETEAFGP